MKIRIELNESLLRELVYDHIIGLMGDVPVEQGDVEIQVKSQQNYKSEWERADFRAIVEKSVTKLG